ncbi:MAG: hypothetical protein ACOYU7_03510 [Bacillota bacterium]
MRINFTDIDDMTIVIAARCPSCNEWVGTIVRTFTSPIEALYSEDWPNIPLEPVACCGAEVWPEYFLIVYEGQILQQVLIGGQDLPVTGMETPRH